LAHAFNVPGPICARANLLKVPSREALAAALDREGVASTPTPFSPLGLLLEGRPNVYGLSSHQAGLFEIQDEGSQLLGLLLDAQPGETVLDFCAGSGGKTLLLAGQMRNQGKLAAHDTDADAVVHRLLPRASRAGVQGLSLFRGGEIPQGFLADAVLVDAPCSSLGSLRRSPDLRFREGPSAWARFPNLQSQILGAAARHVRPGGRLLYATCTFRPEENDEVALRFEAAHPGFRRTHVGPSAASVPWLHPSFLRDGFFETWPHLHGTDAFFAASYRRMV
jgi:16S rRNA (cytosine967-C5)-methyltransferase